MNVSPPARGLALPLAFWTALFLAQAPAVERVSFSSTSTSPAGSSFAPSISADGRYVAFSSTAKLTPDDRNIISDVYVRDRVAKTTRRVSDNRGGDQPAISANGRFVAFRALDGLTRVRVYDLEHEHLPFAGAIPGDTTNYNRPSDSAVISPDGRYVGYAFRPSPELVPAGDQTRGHQALVTDLLTQSGNRVAPYDGGPVPSLSDLGRMAMSYNGSLVVFESKARLSSDDMNDGSDIYLAINGSSNTPVRISHPAAGQPDHGASYSPVISQDGTKIFFLSDDALSPTDTDQRTTIYMAIGSGGSFGGPIPIATAARPLALATQATISGQSIVFLGETSNKQRHAVVRTTQTSGEIVVPTGTLVPTTGPVITGDGSLIAFTALTGTYDQVYVAPVPGVTPRAAPTVTVNHSGEVTSPEDASYSVSASASAPGGGSIRLLEIQQDGAEVNRSTSTFTLVTPTVPRGIYVIQGRAFNDAWIEGQSASFRVIAQPKTATVGISGAQDVVRSPESAYPDGHTVFSGNLRIDNTRNTVSGVIRVVLADAPTPSVMTEAIAPFTAVPPTAENILAVIDVPAVAARSSALVPISGVVAPSQQLGTFYGRARTVVAHLSELKNGAYSSPESPVRTAMVLQTLPALDENTPLPNGGVPVTDTPTADANFNPTTLQSLVIVGRNRLGGPSQAQFSAQAVFNNGTKVCVPAWALQSAGGQASIAANGVMNVSALTASRNVMVQASFYGKTASLPVTIFPLPPRLTASAPVPSATEGGGAGQFRITRSGSRASDLAVFYTVAGTAINGTDYATLSGTVTIPAGAGSVLIPVTPLQDDEVEGLETVVLQLQPDPAYQLGARTARVVLHDDEAIPADQPDLTLRRGTGPLMGQLTFQEDYDDGGGYEIEQALAVSAARNQRVQVVAAVTNRGTSPQVFSLQGSPGSLGVTVQYKAGSTDVTDAVVAGTYSFPSLAPGQTARISVNVTPNVDAPIGAIMECQLHAFSAGSSSDFGEVWVKRVR